MASQQVLNFPIIQQKQKRKNLRFKIQFQNQNFDTLRQQGKSTKKISGLVCIQPRCKFWRRTKNLVVFDSNTFEGYCNRNDQRDFENQGRFDDSVSALPAQLYIKDWIVQDSEDWFQQSANQHQVDYFQNDKIQEEIEDDDDYFDVFDEDLHCIGLRIKRVKPGKNTFFRAVADQLWGDEEQYQNVSERVCEFIQDNLENLIQYDEKYNILNSLQLMQKGRSGGSKLKYWAVQLAYRVNICVYHYQQSRSLYKEFDDSGYNTIYISHHGKQQFNSVRKVNDFTDGKPRKIKLNSIKIPDDVDRYLKFETRPKIPDEILICFKDIDNKQILNEQQKKSVKQQLPENFNEEHKGQYDAYTKERDQQYQQQNFWWSRHKWQVPSLNQELNKIGLREKNIQGDGNCLFGAVADQLCGEYADPDEVREIIVDYIEQNEEKFSSFVENCSFQEYIKNKRRRSCWGGYIELQAASEVFQVNICIFEYNKPRRLLNNFPDDEDVQTLYLAYTGAHYNSVRQIDDFSQETPKKLRLEKKFKQLDENLKMNTVNDGTNHEENNQLQKNLEKIRLEVLHNRQQRNQDYQLKENKQEDVKPLHGGGKKIVDLDQFKGLNVMMYLSGYVFSAKQIQQLTQFLPWFLQKDNRKNINGYANRSNTKNSNISTGKQKLQLQKGDEKSIFLQTAVEL